VTLKLDDTSGSGGCTIEYAGSSGSSKIVLSGSGVEITFSGKKVAITASSVSVNDGVLEVL
jgi:hypothetical protein